MKATLRTSHACVPARREFLRVVAILNKSFDKDTTPYASTAADLLRILAQFDVNRYRDKIFFRYGLLR